jgi:hypothetical protein
MTLHTQLADEYLTRLKSAIAERDEVCASSDLLQAEFERTLGTAERLRRDIAALSAGGAADSASVPKIRRIELT